MARVCLLQLVSYKAARSTAKWALLRLVACNNLRLPRSIADITSTVQSHTYWPEAHRASCLRSIQTQLCCKAAKLQLGPRLLKQVRWNTNTRCGRVLTALKAAATAATRTRHTRAALSERRETAEHSMQAAATPPASDPASTKKQRSAARDERTSIGNLSDFYA